MDNNTCDIKLKGAFLIKSDTQEEMIEKFKTFIENPSFELAEQLGICWIAAEKKST